MKGSLFFALALAALCSGCATSKPTDTCVSVERVADSGSMVPVIMPTSWVTLDFCYPYDDLRTGDIVVYRNSKGDRIIHRLTGTRWADESWSVKGDANAGWDYERVTRDNFESLCVAHGRGAELTAGR